MENSKDALEKLGSVVSGKKELLILTHTHPDPDAIAAAVALRLLLRELFHVDASIAYSGIIARAENRTMVKKLNLPLKQYSRIKASRYDGLALVDSQPGAGNNVLDASSFCDIVIDHHPRRDDTKGAFVVIEPELGASATILIEWLDAAGVDLSADIATALAYAISSETQNMYREAARRDIRAYLSVYVRASIRKLAGIINANLPHYYFLQLGDAINNALMFGTMITTHLDEIRHPEIVAEMADFLLKHERIGTVLVSGRFRNHLIISIRTRSEGINAGRLIKQLPLDPDNVGGHDRTAGGFFDLHGKDRKEVEEINITIRNAFAALLGYENPSWRKLLDQVPRKS
ncbi:DHH family phosphoesterase [Sediminispirochaeta bajacaliforniensis]|uniref:DHH family phosphoesterase n=1 Tax=Sediminispirochaeta bajacaliforniensis TaxID=148 RepID=UPI00036FC25B|nr:DHH family phosphoesterase [Sediminispirochaeta bajacaliforniensis]